MKRDEFLRRLSDALGALSDSERSEVLDYYREMICDGVENGGDEASLIAGFGSAEEIAAQILAESRGAVPARQSVPPRDAPRTYAAEGTVHTVVVDAQNIRVEVRPVTSGPVQVHFTPTEQDLVSCTEEGGVFTFRHTMPLRFSFTFGWRMLLAGSRVILVDIPAGFDGELQIVTRNAGISAEKLAHLSRARFSTSNSRISLRNLTCGTLEAGTSNAALDFHNLRGNSCDAHTSNGSVTAEDCVFASELRLKSSNASVRLNGAGADRMEFISSNGSVRGTVQGDMRQYAIYSHTSNGSCSLPSEMAYPDQTKSLRVFTSNARIDVKFLPN